MGGRLGAMLGAAIGHRLDREGQEDQPMGEAARYKAQIAFFTATFSVMGHLAKVDGRVTEAEIGLARNVMNRLDLSDDQRKSAIRLFTEGKHGDFPFADALGQFQRDCRNSFSLIRMFIEIQLELALVDGALHPSEERLLLQMCDRLKFSRFEFRAMQAILEAQMRMAGRGQQDRSRQQSHSVRSQPSLEDAYAALGVKASASNEEIKRTYRKLMSQHHPDKLVAAGLPDQMVKLANEKTQQIRKAYELVRKARDL